MRRALTILTLSVGLLAFPGTALAERDKDRGYASHSYDGNHKAHKKAKKFMANIIGKEATTTKNIRRKSIAIGSPPTGILAAIIIRIGASVASIRSTQATKSCVNIITHPITIATGAIIGAIIEVINTATTSTMTITWSG